MRSRISKLVGTVVGLAVMVSACTVGGSTTTTVDGGSTLTTGTPSGPPVGQLVSHSLVAFDACDSFLDYVIAQAVDMVGPYGLEDPFFGQPWFGFADGLIVEESAALDSAQGGDATSLAFSGTNVQVLGVDEPDIVKTDGERIVVLSEGTLIVADITGSEPRVVGRLQIGNLSVQSLFLSGDTVLMFGSEWNSFRPLVEGDAEFAPSYQTPSVQLVQVDISGNPEVVRTMSIDGQFVSGRMIDDTVRLVLRSGPVGFEWSYPSGSGLRAERKAIEENQKIIRNSAPDNWIPYYIVTDADGDVTDEGTLFDCDRASHPEEFSGLNVLSVITVDLLDGLEVTDSTGLLATGDTIYSSATSLYVATQNWDTWLWARQGGGDREPESVITDIHKFDISDARITRYEASGVVEGYLLNQFAMDEHEGRLRVASTTQPNWWGSGFESESLVTVLEQVDGELSQIGVVDGLGKTEQIYSVRFVGDMAYVVTFRQTDPLYTVDLSDPDDPKVVGELKILGYSAYLHPLADGLLIGIGQDATESGRVEGTQVSVFDVSDPTDPKRVDQITLSKGSNSEVEYDHHAFLYWEPTGLAMVPVQQWWYDQNSESAFLGAVGFEVDDNGHLHEVQRVSHPGGDRDDWDWRARIVRSVVVGDNVYTISAKGIMKSELDGLDELDWLGF